MAASRPRRRGPKVKSRLLSPRERQVLLGIAASRTYAEIGHDLDLGYETIKTCVSRIRAKLGIRNKTGLAIWATKNPKQLRSAA